MSTPLEEAATPKDETYTARPQSTTALVMQGYVDMIKRHPVVASLVLMLIALTLGLARYHGNLTKRAAYVCAVAAGVLITDLVSVRDRRSRTLLPVRRPRLELALTIACTIVSVSFLWWRFKAHQRTPLGHWAVPFLNGLFILFVINIPLLLFYLVVMRYRLHDLGFRFRGLRCVLPVMFCLALASVLAVAFSPHGLLSWLEDKKELLATYGRPSPVLWLIRLFFVPGLSEEFLRMSLQTRVGAALKNPAVGWFFAAWIWSSIHIPSFESTSPVLLLLTVIQIVPIGLLWGYIMHRTQSVLPTALLHSTNVWGLTNF